MGRIGAFSLLAAVAAALLALAAGAGAASARSLVITEAGGAPVAPGTAGYIQIDYPEAECVNQVPQIPLTVNEAEVDIFQGATGESSRCIEPNEKLVYAPVAEVELMSGGKGRILLSSAGQLRTVGGLCRYTFPRMTGAFRYRRSGIALTGTLNAKLAPGSGPSCGRSESTSFTAYCGRELSFQHDEPYVAKPGP